MKKPKPNNGTGKYIFLSYPHKNDEQAARIIEALQASGYRVWFDEGLELGSRYNQVIAEHIEECEAFMCLLTPGYYQSKYCRMEFTFALEECEKEIIPVFIGDDRQIRKSFPAGMRMFLIGVNAFMMNERVDIDDFMRKISETSMLDACREDQESESKPKRQPQAGLGVVSKITLPNARVDRFEALKKARVNDTIRFGSYWQDAEGKVKSPIEWQVLDKTDKHALVLSKHALDRKPYHEKHVGVTWETCTLRKWLNSEFLTGAFTEEEQKMIQVTHVENVDNPDYGTEGGSDTEDRVFLLSIEEAQKYFPNNEARQCKPTAFAVKKGAYVDKKNGHCWWWLRSPGLTPNSAADVDGDGSLSRGGLNVGVDSVAVRPALWLILNL